jgi:hypothetical protein
MEPIREPGGTFNQGWGEEASPAPLRLWIVQSKGVIDFLIIR